MQGESDAVPLESSRRCRRGDDPVRQYFDRRIFRAIRVGPDGFAAASGCRTRSASPSYASSCYASSCRHPGTDFRELP